MRKAVQIRVILWVEGEDEPAHDFAGSSMEAVQKMIAAGAAGFPDLRVSITRIEEDTTDYRDEEQGDRF